MIDTHTTYWHWGLSPLYDLTDIEEKCNEKHGHGMGKGKSQDKESSEELTLEKQKVETDDFVHYTWVSLVKENRCWNFL